MGRILFLSLKRQCFHLLLLFALLLISFSGIIYAVGRVEAKKNIFRRWSEGLDYDDVYNLFDIENEPEIVKAWSDSISKLREQGLISQAGCNSYENIEDPQIMTHTEEEYAKITYYADFISMIHVNLIEGSTEPLLTKKKTEKKPALISPALKEQEHLSLGDDYKGPDGCVYTIAGVLDPKSLFFDGACSPVVLSLKHIKNRKLLIITSPEEYGDSRFCVCGIIKPSKEADLTVFSDTVVQVFKKNGIDIDCHNLKQQEELAKHEDLPHRLRNDAFSSMILLLSIMGLIGRVMAALNERHEEFGIYLTLGMSKKHIYLLIFLEISILFTTAFAAAALVMTVYFRQTYLDPDIHLGISWVLMNGRILVVGSLIMMLSTLSSLFLPFKKIKRLSVIELVQEKE